MRNLWFFIDVFPQPPSGSQLEEMKNRSFMLLMTLIKCANIVCSFYSKMTPPLGFGGNDNKNPKFLLKQFLQISKIKMKQ